MYDSICRHFWTRGLKLLYLHVRVGLGVETCAGATVGRREGMVVGVILQLEAVAERHVAAIS